MGAELTPGIGLAYRATRALVSIGRTLLATAALGCAAGPAPDSGSVVPTPEGGRELRFDNEGERRGIDGRYLADARRAKVIATMGGGVAAADYDGDGDVDLYLTTGITDARDGSAKDGNFLYRNRGDGTFEDVGEAAGVALRAWSMGATFADADGDGHLDLYVTCLGPNVHYRSRGDGTFEDMGTSTGIADERFGSGAAFADFDRDGDLDLVVVNYLDTTIEEEMAAPQFVIRTPAEYEGQPSALFANRGDGTFEDVTAQAGTDNRDGRGLTARAFDHDLDGWQDIYIANDTVPNKLYRNLGGMRFEDVSLISGSAIPADTKARAGMGVALGDADGDGLEDLLVTNFSGEPNSYFHNEGAGLFLELTDAAGLGLPGDAYVAWGTSFFDADLDGDLDVAVANGHLAPKLVRILGRTTKKEDAAYLDGCWACPVELYSNEAGRFREMGGRAGDLGQHEVAARGLAACDVDGDGDLDVVVSARDQGSPLFINKLQERGPKGHWLAVRLRARGRNPFAVGARVEVTAGATTMVRTIAAGGSYVGSEPPEAHFGMGPHAVAARVRVAWPTGGETVLTDVPADRAMEIREGP